MTYTNENNKAAKAYSYLLTNSAVQLGSSPVDLGDTFIMEWLDRQHGTVMPPSPGVDYYTVNYNLTYQKKLRLDYTVDLKWHPVTSWLLKNLTYKWQVLHRSRVISIAASQLRVNELHHRSEQQEKYKNVLARLALSDTDSKAVLDIVIDTTIKYLNINYDYITYYINEHEDSSIGGGFRWADLRDAPTEIWLQLYNTLLSNLEQMKQYGYLYEQHRLSSGIRARSDGFNSISEIFSRTERSMDRSRIVMFGPWMSTYTIFLTNKKQWYSDILKQVIDYFHARPEFHFPYSEGGEVFVNAAQTFNDFGDQFKAYDGKSWESSVGVILGKWFHAMMVVINGIPTLPSGHSLTSLLGTIATIIVSRSLRGIIYALGDDDNYFGPDIIKYPIEELQVEDTKYFYLLGLSFKIDPFTPRIIGLKGSMDRADAVVPITTIPFIGGYQRVNKKRDDRERVLWAQMYMGQFGSRTLIDAIQDNKQYEFIAPGLMIEQYLSNSAQDSNELNAALEWAKSNGYVAQ